MKKSLKNRGITLYELLIVAGIILVLTAIVTTSFVDMRKQQTLQNTAADVASILSKASSFTLASVDASEYGVHFDIANNSVTLFKGKTYNPNSVDNERTVLSGLISISSVALTGGVTDVYFNRLTNIPSATGEVTLTVSGINKVVVIGPTGNISLR